MSTLSLTATEFSRGLSEFLNQVQYRGQVLDIERGKRVVARVIPVDAGRASAGYPIGQLDDLLARGPQLTGKERAAMAADLGAVRAQLGNRADPWAS